MSHLPDLPEKVSPFRLSRNSNGENELVIYGIPLWNIVATMLALVVGFLVAFVAYAQLAPEKPVKKKGRDPKLPAPSEIVSLRIYPIKSCRGIEIQACQLKKSGLDLDRHWMFVDAKTKEFLTIRSNPLMTLINTGLEGPVDPKLGSHWTTLNIGIQDTESRVSVPCYPTKEWLEENCNLIEVEIWGGKTDAYQYSDDINQVFTEFFKKDVLLVYKGPSPRMAGGSANVKLYGKEEPVNFPDVMSLQVASEASLNDLNERLRIHGQEELTIERFRPNIIIKGNEPWEEDRWKKVRINYVDHARAALWRTPLDVLARCARCQVPNVNPDTAEKHPKEPWDTLMKFRRVDHGGAAKYKPCFGMLCIPTKDGKIKVGAELEVLEITDKHCYNTAKFDEL